MTHGKRSFLPGIFRRSRVFLSIFLPAGGVLLTSCVILPVYYWTPSTPLIPASDDVLHVHVSGATISQQGLGGESTPAIGIMSTLGASWTLSQTPSSFSTLLGLEGYALMIQDSRRIWTGGGSAIYMDMYASLFRMFSVVQGVGNLRLGFLLEGGNYITGIRANFTPGAGGRTDTRFLAGVLGHVGFGFRMPLSSHSSDSWFQILYAMGPGGGLSTTLRLQNFQFFWSTQLLGTYLSPDYPTIRIGLVISFR